MCSLAQKELKDFRLDEWPLDLGVGLHVKSPLEAQDASEKALVLSEGFFIANAKCDTGIPEMPVLISVSPLRRGLRRSLHEIRDVLPFALILWRLDFHGLFHAY